MSKLLIQHRQLGLQRRDTLTHAIGHLIQLPGEPRGGRRIVIRLVARRLHAQHRGARPPELERQPHGRDGLVVQPVAHEQILRRPR